MSALLYPAQSLALRWSAAASPWDPPALAALYCADAVFHGGRPGHSVGSTAILAYFESYRNVILSCTLAWRDPVARSLGEGQLLVQGYADMRFLLAGDRASASVLRATWVLVQERSTWRIAQHHFSTEPAAPPLGD